MHNFEKSFGDDPQTTKFVKISYDIEEPKLFTSLV